MNIICLIFGHRTFGDRHDGSEYLEVRPESHDGIGRWHATVRGNCSRCGKVFRVGRIHIPKEDK